MAKRGETAHALPEGELERWDGCQFRYQGQDFPSLPMPVDDDVAPSQWFVLRRPLQAPGGSGSSGGSGHRLTAEQARTVPTPAPVA